MSGKASASECALCGAMKDEKLRIYDGKLCAAFVILNPVSQFHCLVLPKRHVERMSDLRGDELVELFQVMGRLSSFIHSKSSDYPRDALVSLNRGSNATQPHIHFHVINSVGGVRTLVDAQRKCGIYPPCTREHLEQLAEEYRGFVDAPLVD